MSKCTNIIKIADVPSAGELLKVVIDNNTEALWFYPLADAMQFLNQDVIVEYRKDVYNGQLQNFIKTFTVPTQINTINASEKIKLYCDNEDNFSDVSFNEIEVGDTRMARRVFCISQEIKSSSKAVWLEMLIRDKFFRVATLRLFSYDTTNVKFAGKYILTNLTRSVYGFQSDEVREIDGECPRNPEIDLAIKYIRTAFAQDIVAQEFINKTDFFGQMLEHIDYEPGYGLMRLAMELEFCETINDIARDLNVEAIKYALLCSHAYCTRPLSILSKSVNNVIIAQKFKWPNLQLVVRCLDSSAEDEVPERTIMSQIKKTVDAILSVRKGVH